jgi:hypothetical protein
MENVNATAIAHDGRFSTAAEIRALAEQNSWTAPERIVLPKSGFALFLRKPTRWYWSLRRAEWPADFRERLDLAAEIHSDEGLTKEDMQFWFREQDRMAVQAFVEPKASANPDFNSIDPRWLPDEDRVFIRQYLGGQVSASGTRLETFSGSERSVVADGGGAGEAVREVADRSAADGPAGMADQRGSQ